jgi:hypothetical protein
MAGLYRPRHPERTVLYRVLFHYFDRFLAEYESRFEKEYGFFRPIIKEVVDRYLDCGNPRCGLARIRCPDCGEERLSQDAADLLQVQPETPGITLPCGAPMKVIAFLTDYPVVDRIINHLQLTFVAERPPPPHIASQEVLSAAEQSAEYFS